MRRADATRERIRVVCGWCVMTAGFIASRPPNLAGKGGGGRLCVSFSANLRRGEEKGEKEKTT